MFESKAGVLLIGGLGFFAFAFVSNAWVPILMYRHLPEVAVSDLPNANLLYEFEDLSQRFPDSFRSVYGKSYDEMSDDERRQTDHGKPGHQPQVWFHQLLPFWKLTAA